MTKEKRNNTGIDNAAINEDNNTSYISKITEQIILINKLCVGAFIFIIALLIVLLYLQGGTSNNDSYNQNIEYFISQQKKDSTRIDEIEQLLRNLVDVQKVDSILVEEKR